MKLFQFNGKEAQDENGRDKRILLTLSLPIPLRTYTLPYW